MQNWVLIDVNHPLMGRADADQETGRPAVYAAASYS